MRISNIMQCTDLGGMERASLRLMQALVARGHALEVISLNPTGALGPLLARAGIPTVGLTYRNALDWRTATALRRVLRERAPDALLMTGHNLLAMLALPPNIPRGRRLLAQHFHHTDVKPAWQWRLIYGLALRRFGAITFPSDFVRHEAEALCPGLIGRANTVPNPLSLPTPRTPASRAHARASLGLPDGSPVIGNAGWLIPRKRFDVFLATAQRLLALHPSCHFVIAGDGPQRPSLYELAAALGVSARVHWLGWRNDMAEFYHAIDLLLFNSDWDALPTTPLEAMSYGLPVVASVVHGGLGELLEHGREGWLLDRHDTEELAQAVLEALMERGRVCGTAGRERIARSCDVDSIAANVEALLTEANTQ